MDSMIRLFGNALNRSTSFASNGLGVLSEAISCSVVEERNGQFELTLTYPMSGKLFNQLVLRNIIVVKPNPYSNPQPFRIYSISRPINGIITVNAEHISYDLSGYSAKVVKKPVAGAHGYFDVLNNGEYWDSDGQYHPIIIPEGSCPFTFWTNDQSGTEFRIEEIVSVRNALGDHSGSVLDHFNGEYEWDGLTVKFWRTYTQDGETTGGRGEDRGVSIRYGKNMTNFEQEENCQKIYTGVYPFWHYDDYRHDLVELPYPHYVPAEGTFAYTRILPLDVTDQFMRRPSDEELMEYAQNYMKTNKIGEPDISFDVEFIPLSQTTEYKDYVQLEQVHLCDTINVFFPEMNVNAKAKVTRTEYDAIGGKYTSISLGNYKQGISDTVATTQVNVQDKINTSLLDQAILEATDLITGNVGGYVVLHNPYNNPDGSDTQAPNEILVMDSDAVDPDTGQPTAQNVWRWNQGGLAFSSNGYNSEHYDVAITSDGKINASMITTGLLRGDLIEAGSITADKLSVEYTNGINQQFAVADGRIMSLVSDVDQIRTASGDMTRHISQLEQDLEALRLSFTTIASGGINKIQNSSGANGVSNDWTVSSGATVVAKQDAEEQSNTDSGSAFEIRNGEISQILNLHVGEWYVFSARVKSYTNSRSYAYIKNGDSNVYAFDISETCNWTKVYTDPFQANADQLEVVCGTAGEYILAADLMLSLGQNRQNWTPAPNEIYTTNVKIDKRGINITNDASDTQTLIDNTKFAVIHQDREVLTVNKDITTLGKTQVKDEWTIGYEENNEFKGKGRFVPVSEGVDFVIL